ncbi:hypothetical protein KAM329_037390 [Aeromonas caviae]|nr:hypothetical protein KAM329_037390 [Aeromonas caviae]
MPCYRTELVREGGAGDFSGKINKLGVGAAGACGRLDKRDLKADAFPLPASRFPLPASRFPLNAQRSTLKAQRPTFTVYGWGSEVIALPRAMRCSREGRRGTGEQVVGRGRKTR